MSSTPSMIAPSEFSSVSAPAQAVSTVHTVWGLDPVALHQRFWAARGIQVVRQGEPSEIVRHAELFLLIDPRLLVLFPMPKVIDAMNWIKPQVLFMRLGDDRESGYRERILTDPATGRFLRFQRLYDAAGDQRLARAVLTADREVARSWQSSSDPQAGWRRLRRYTPAHERLTMEIDGRVFDRSLDREIALFLQELMQVWRQPDATIARAVSVEPMVYRDPTSEISGSVRFIGPVWVGAGRTVDAETTLVGPAVLWDDPKQRPATEDIAWLTIERGSAPEEATVRDTGRVDRALRWVFDRLFSIIALAVTVPLYPFILLAIWLEDGRPFFFAHTRETMGGREFPCIKFRSMRKDAERMKMELKTKNQADGPQFFIADDPRLTRVGRFLRKYNLDELPQFLNVLAGQMAVVGPRPSPRVENQFCPPWREARLSVRPGITGLWQIRRTRQSGADFQEWIKYDIEYVENRSWRLDLWIIYTTVAQVFRKVSRS